MLRGIASTFVNIFRGTPLLLWAFMFYFGLPQLTGWEVSVWTAGVLTLSLNAGAYVAGNRSRWYPVGGSRPA